MKSVGKESVFIDEISDIWNCLTQDERIFLRENTQYHEFKKNMTIYKEGEIPEFLYCLITGKVKLYKEGVGERQQIIRLVRPNENFAYRASFSEHPYLTSAAALEPVTAFSVPLKVVKQIISSNTQLAINFIKELSDDLGLMDARVVSLTQKHIRGRLAEALVMLLDIYGVNPKTKVLNGTLSREDLASFSNMTASNAIRTLNTFEAEGIIRMVGKQIEVLNESLLRKISALG